MAHPGFSKGEGHNQESGGEAPCCRRLRGFGGVAPSRQQIFAVFTLKTLILANFFIVKGHALNAVTI